MNGVSHRELLFIFYDMCHSLDFLAATINGDVGKCGSLCRNKYMPVMSTAPVPRWHYQIRTNACKEGKELLLDQQGSSHVFDMEHIPDFPRCDRSDGEW